MFSQPECYFCKPTHGQKRARALGIRKRIEFNPRDLLCFHSRNAVFAGQHMAKTRQGDGDPKAGRKLFRAIHYVSTMGMPSCKPACGPSTRQGTGDRKRIGN